MLERIAAFVAATALVLGLTAVVTGVVDTPVTEVAVAEAHADAVNWDPPHANKTWWSHGKKHLRTLYFHCWCGTDTYNVYHLVELPGGSYWSYQGRDNVWQGIPH